MARILLIAFFFSSLLHAAHSSEKIPDSHLNIVLEGVLRGIPMKFSEDALTVSVSVSTGNAGEVSERLTRALGTLDGFLYHFAGKKLEEGLKSKPQARYSDLSVSSVEDAISLLKNIFGEVFDETDFNESAFKRCEASYCDGKLATRYYESNKCQVLTGFQSALLARLIDKNADDLRRAINERDYCLGAPSKDPIDGDGLVGLARDSVRIMQVTDKNSCLTIDLERMFGLCYAPVVDEKVSSMSDDVVFSINKKHLVLHLKQLFLNDKLLRLVRDDEQVYAQQLFLTERLSIAKPSYVIFAIDRSTSLKGAAFKSLQANLKATIKKIWDKDDRTLIRLVFFADNREEMGVFSREQGADLFHLIDTAVASGGTRLLDTVRDEIDFINAQDLIKKFSVNLIVFTDGDSNVGSNCCDFSSSVKSVAKGGKGFTAYTMGFGDHCNHTVLANIARETFGQSFQVGNMSMFLSHLSSSIECQYEKRAEQVLVDLKHLAVSEAMIPVTQSHYGITPSNLLIPCQDAQLGSDVDLSCAVSKDVVGTAKFHLSQAYFKALEMINQPSSESLASVDAIKRKLVLAQEDFSVGIVQAFIDALLELRAERISKSDAKERIETAYGIFLK